MGRRFDVDVPADQIAACIGTKEFVGTLPQWLRLRRPDRDTVLYPGDLVSDLRDGRDPRRLPRRAGADVADRCGSSSTRSIPSDAARALALWVNSPANPSGVLDDLGRGGGVGSRPRCAGVLRRVLHRVHVGRSRSHDPRARHPTAWSPCTRCRSARTWPGPGSGSTPVTPTRSSTCRRSASTSA